MTEVSKNKKNILNAYGNHVVQIPGCEQLLAIVNQHMREHGDQK